MPEPLPHVDDPVLAAALAIADGAPVDWSAMASVTSFASGDAVSSSLQGLRALEQLVQGHRSLQELRPAAPADTTILTQARSLDGGAVCVRWGPLLVTEKIGRGAYGDVYRAWDPRLEREVALKLLREGVTGGAESPAVEEGRLLARVRHPNVVTVFGAERGDGRVGLWMELIRGRTLAEEIQADGPFPPEAAARAGVEVCRALAAVHRAGLLHRDVKAQNVMRDDTGRLVLTDFGTGLALDEVALDDPQLAGTPLYLAPEVLAGDPASTASDLYSVGVLLYHLLTSDFPVTGRTLDDVRAAHARGARTPLHARRPDVPAGLAGIVERLLLPDPSGRHGTAADVADALAATLRPESPAPAAGRPSVIRARGPWFAAAAIAAAGLAVGWGATRQQAGKADAGAGAAPADGPVSRQVPDPACSGVPALDGSIACVEQLIHALNRGATPPLPLVHYQPHTGEMRVLRAGDEDAPVTSVAISPDGADVAYTVARHDRPTEVRRLTIATGQDRLIATPAGEASFVTIVAWARDGHIECRLFDREGAQSLALLSPDGGPLTAVFRFPSPPATFARAPDGSRIAFDVRQHESGPERDLRVCELREGGACATVAPHPANDVSPIWAPDGRLLFVSDRSGVMGLWSVAVDGVSAVQPPDLVEDVGRSRPVPYGFDGNGVFYLDRVVDEFDVFEADLSGAAGTAVRRSPRAVDVNKSPAYSPDGRYLAYVSRRGPFAEAGGTRLVVQRLEDGQEREFRLDFRPNMTRLAWSPDGRTIAMKTLLGLPLATSGFGVHLVSVEDGRVQHTLRRVNPPERDVEDQIAGLAWPEPDTLLFVSSGGVRRFDIADGSEHPVWAPPAGHRARAVAVSRDGAWMAVQTTEGEGASATYRTFVVDATGQGGAREVWAVGNGEAGVLEAWTADGAALLVTRGRPTPFRDRRFHLWRVPVDGGAPVQLPLSNAQLTEVTVHPDNRRVAFMMGAPSTQFWLTTGLARR
jgi:Tol biopolymer transport system component